MRYEAAGQLVVEAIYRRTLTKKRYAFLAPDRDVRVGQMLWAGQEPVDVVQMGSEYDGTYFQTLRRQRRGQVA